MTNLPNPPTRLCCGQPHWGVQCLDGLVMCCLCFDRFPLKKLSREDGVLVDVCLNCAAREGRGLLP